MNFESACQKIKILISEEFQRHDYLLNTDILNGYEKKDFKEIMAREADFSVYENSLKNLARYLKLYYKQKTVLLIDEYDTPIHSAFHYGY
jgi:hypothetical protein